MNLITKQPLNSFRRIALGAGLIFSGASAALAATASFTSTAPTTDILLQTTSFSSTGSVQLRNLSSSNRWVGFGFATTEATTLDKATLYITFDSTTGNGMVSSGALGATIKIDIVSLTSQTASPSTPYTVVYSETATAPLSYSNETLMTFDFTTPVTLLGSENYGIVFSFTDTAANRSINFRTTSSGVGGTGSYGDLFYTGDQGSTWTTGTNPYAFVLQTAASSVPEPATYATLCGLAALGAIACSRRRRQSSCH
ncbi:MAG TPA: hypothetical protein VIO38_14605 [Rariglobus sp.]